MDNYLSHLKKAFNAVMMWFFLYGVAFAWFPWTECKSSKADLSESPSQQESMTYITHLWWETERWKKALKNTQKKYFDIYIISTACLIQPTVSKSFLASSSERFRFLNVLMLNDVISAWPTLHPAAIDPFMHHFQSPIIMTNKEVCLS